MAQQQFHLETKEDNFFLITSFPSLAEACLNFSWNLTLGEEVIFRIILRLKLHTCFMARLNFSRCFVWVTIFMMMKIWSIMHAHIRSLMLFPSLFFHFSSFASPTDSEENVERASSHHTRSSSWGKKKKKSQNFFRVKNLVSKYLGIFTVFSLDECEGGSFFNELH